MTALLKRGLALTLPMCLLWLFVACLAVCSLHAENDSGAGSSAPHSLVSTESDDCCFVADGERSVMPERITFTWISPKLVRVISHSTDFVSHIAHSHKPDLHSRSGPNLKLLGSLRI